LHIKFYTMQTQTHTITTVLLFLFILCSTGSFAQIQEQKDASKLMSGKIISDKETSTSENKAPISLGEPIEINENTSESNLLKDDNPKGKSKSKIREGIIVRQDSSDTDFQSE